MHEPTQSISHYVLSKNINVSQLARDTGIPYSCLYDSLMNENRNRDLRDWEFLRLCIALRLNPVDFAEKQKTDGSVFPTSLLS